MKISIRISQSAISEGDAPIATDGCGALAEFRGVVRPEEAGAAIAGLDYEAYQPMAEMEMERILRGLTPQFPCEAVTVVHRVGHVPAGETSLLVRVAAKHRAEAFGLLTAFLDRLKEDVPIWKLRP